MTVTIITGDCRATLAQLDAGSAQTCVTSPPYFGLRDYGHDGQIGLEPTPDEYVAELVDVFRAVRRVLRDDGTLWLNLGDSYSGGGGFSPDAPSNRAGSKQTTQGSRDYKGRQPTPGLKPKDLIGIPWRVAFALQADGWYLRSDIIWHKPNPMPESVTDRPTKAHEYLFLLTKSERYYYDADAIKEPASWTRENNPEWAEQRAETNAKKGAGNRNAASAGFTKWDSTQGRNKRSVWTVATTPYKGAHFATFPPALIEPCILAGSARQACETCGAAWARVVDRGESHYRQLLNENGQTWQEQEKYALENGQITAPGQAGNTRTANGTVPSLRAAQRTERGFAPACACDVNTGAGRSLVLDPFGGAGTTAVVADRLGRDAVLCELNPEYAAMATERREEAASHGYQESLL